MLEKFTNTRKQTIIDAINQAIIYMTNYKVDSVHTYGFRFSDEFTLNKDYIKEYIEHVDTLNEYVFREETVKSYHDGTFNTNPTQSDESSMRFDLHSFNIATTWGYGKFFDGESIELTEASEKLVLAVSVTLSKLLNCEVTINGDVDVDYPDDMRGIIQVNALEVSENNDANSKTKRVRKTPAEKKLDALNSVDKYKKELEEFNTNLHTRLINQKSAKKCCNNCDSNIAVSFLKNHKCPVCNTPFYTTTDLKRVGNLTERITKYNKEVKKYSDA